MIPTVSAGPRTWEVSFVAALGRTRLVPVDPEVA